MTNSTADTLVVNRVNKTLANPSTLRNFNISDLESLIVASTDRDRDDLNEFYNQMTDIPPHKKYSKMERMILRREESVYIKSNSEEDVPSEDDTKELFLNYNESKLILETIKNWIIDTYSNTYIISSLELQTTTEENEEQFFNTFLNSLLEKSEEANTGNIKYFDYRLEGKVIDIIFKYKGRIGEETSQKNVFIILVFNLDINTLEFRVQRDHIAKSDIQGVTDVSSFMYDNILSQLEDYITVEHISTKKVVGMLFSIYQDELTRVIDTLDELFTRDERDQIKVDFEEFWIEKLSIPEEADELDDEIQTLLNDSFEAIYYYSRSKSLANSEFGDRYITHFSFTDNLSTESKTRNEHGFPVYKERLFWILKSIIELNEEIQSLGMSSSFELEGERLTVDATVSALLGTLHIRYISGAKDLKRGEKHDHFIKFLLQYLQAI